MTVLVKNSEKKISFEQILLQSVFEIRLLHINGFSGRCRIMSHNYCLMQKFDLRGHQNQAKSRKSMTVLVKVVRRKSYFHQSLLQKVPSKSKDYTLMAFLECVEQYLLSFHTKN